MPVYDFHELSSLDLEELVRDLLQAEWGVRLESFKAGADQGIDLRFSAELNKNVVIQCKHYAVSGIRKLLRHLRHQEAAKVRKLNPSRYILATSVGLSPANKTEISNIFAPYLRTFQDIVGRDELNNLIAQHPQVERANFKLWLTSATVLSRVLHNAEYFQTEFEIDRVKAKLKLYVQNDAYPRAFKILDSTKLVVISGVPGIGKTTLAEMLLFEHLERGYEPVVIKSDVVEAKRLYRPGTKQVFYFDDFLGQTFLRDQSGVLSRNQDAILSDFMEAVRKSKLGRFILTTREHILRNAILNSERLRHSPLLDHHCVLELADYTLPQKGRILFNHLYFSELPSNYKAALLEDEFYLLAVKHPNFSPRIIEWLSAYGRVKNTPPAAYRSLFERFLDHPEELWLHAFRNQISEAARNVLLCLYALGGKATLPDVERSWGEFHHRMAAKYNFRTSPGEFHLALQELEGSFLRFTIAGPEFLNPSIKDFLSTFLIDQPPLAIDILENVESFEQASRIWQLAVSPTGAKLQTTLLSHEQVATDTLRRLLSESAISDAIENTLELRRTDISTEAKASLLVKVADIYRTDVAFGLLSDGITTVLNRWKTFSPAFEDALELITVLTAAAWSRVWRASFAVQLKTGLVGEFGRSAWSHEFVALIDAVARWGNWNDEDFLAARSGFENYLDDAFSDELSEFNSADELDGLRENISKIGAFLSYDVDASLAAVDEAIADAQEREQTSSGTYDGEWRGGSPAAKTHNDDQEVRRMFGGLLD